MSKITRRFFEVKMADFIEQQAEYHEECKEYAERGWRHHYCFHGANMWVDYDCACGACEDGAPNEYTSPEDARAYFNEWYGTDYDGDDLLGYFEPIEWGNDQVEVVKVHGYENWTIRNEFNSINQLQVSCRLALVSDGTEFDMVLDAKELRLTEGTLETAKEDAL